MQTSRNYVARYLEKCIFYHTACTFKRQLLLLLLKLISFFYFCIRGSMNKMLFFLTVTLKQDANRLFMAEITMIQGAA